MIECTKAKDEEKEGGTEEGGLDSAIAGSSSSVYHNRNREKEKRARERN